MSVLVTDLAGSTDLRVRLGEDRARVVQQRHDALLAAAVTDAGGTVVKGLGDGVLAMFESASDAIAAAAAIQRSARGHNRRAPDEALGIRAGIAVGDVDVIDDDCFGLPVVEASRLCAAADAGEILVGDLVRLLARGRGGHRFVGERTLELKGIPDPVAVSSVEWAAAAGDGGALPPALAGPFVLPFRGRGDELDRLADAWERAAGGATEAVLLAGEPGIGKTRLAAELAERVRADGGTVLYGHCDESVAVPYLPFAEALRGAIARQTSPVLGGRPAELSRLAPELADVTGVAPPAIDPEVDRYRLFDAVVSWIGAVTERSSALLVVDDLHWADAATLLLLRHVVSAGSVRGLLVVGTYRDTDVDRQHALGQLLDELRRRERVERIALDGLDLGGVTGIVEGAAGHELDDDGARVAELVWAGTDGNPFFVGQVLQHLVETGVLAEHGGRWSTCVSVEDIGVPEGVRDVVGRRLSRLSEDVNRLLAAGAVIGRDFTLEVLSTATDVSVDDAIDALEHAVHAGILRERGAGSYHFAHAMLRSTLYEELTATRRARWHRRIAEALDARTSDLAALAHHWVRAGTGSDVVQRALAALEAAAADALLRAAPDEAARLLGDALAVADDSGVDDGEWQLRIRILLGEAQRHAGDPSHRETLLAAAADAAARGDVEMTVRATLANQRAIYSTLGEVDEERVAGIERAIELVGDTDPASSARLWTRLAMEKSFALDMDERLAMVRDAIDLARGVDDPVALAEARFAEAYTARPLPGPGAIERWQDAVALTSVLSDPTLVGMANIYLAMASLDAGRRDLADEATVEAVRIAEESAHPSLRWRVRLWRCARANIEARPRDAMAIATEAVEVGRAGGQLDADRMYPSQLLESMSVIGQYDTGLFDALRAAADAMPTYSIVHSIVAFGAAEEGNLEEARRRLDAMHAAGWPIRLDPGWQFAMATTALAIHRVGTAEHARAMLPRLVPYADTGVMSDVVHVCDLATALGLLHAAAGDLDAAEAQLAHAELVTERVGAPGWRARTRVERARVLLRRDRPGDRELAERLIADARQTASRLGLGRIERDAAEVAALLDDGACGGESESWSKEAHRG